MGTIEDLHGRLKANVDSIQQLNQQLNTLNRENIRQRAELERERAARQRLDMKLDGRDQTITSLHAQVSGRRGYVRNI